jgi:sugar phosphate isomerase/epimerase
MRPRVTFSTLACPHWSLETTVERARGMGYDGIEWRGGEAGHVKPAWSQAQRTALRERMRDANLFSLAVTAYTAFVSGNKITRAANVDDLKRHIDLAADLGARYVRAFLGELEPGQTLAQAYPYVIEALERALPYAAQVGVGIAIEHHDDFIRTAALVPILEHIQHPQLGAVWDIANAFSAGEMPDAGVRNLRDRIFYVQVKDGVGADRQWRLTNVGEGQVPLGHALKLLRGQDYHGAFSVEWEYAWHPDLEPPERALPQAVAHLYSLFDETFQTKAMGAVR